MPASPGNSGTSTRGSLGATSRSRIRRRALMFLNVQEWIGELWAEVLPQFPMPTGMDNVWMEPVEPQDNGGGDDLFLQTRLMFDQPFRLNLPGLDAVGVIFAPGGGGIIVMVALASAPRFTVRVGVPLALWIAPTLL